MKTKITFKIRNLELYPSINISDFKFSPVSNYDQLRGTLRDGNEVVTYEATSEIHRNTIDEIKEKIERKRKQLEQITWLLSFAQGVRISPTGFSINNKIEGLPTGETWASKPAVFPRQKVISDGNLNNFIDQFESLIDGNDNYLRENNLLYPIAFYLAGIEEDLIESTVILKFISFESLVHESTEPYIFGKDKLSKGLKSGIETILSKNTKYKQLPQSRKDEMKKKIFELKRRPIKDRINEFLNSNISLPGHQYNISRILKVRNGLVHTGKSYDFNILKGCYIELDSIICRAVLSKLGYNGKYWEIIGGKEINFP